MIIVDLIRALKIKLIIFPLAVAAGCFHSPGIENKIVSIVEIDKTTSAHSTTRQFQRKVLFVKDYWYIFYSNGENTYYRSSQDGELWSEGIVIEKGLPYSSSTDVIYENGIIYHFNSIEDDPDPEIWRNTLYARKGVIDKGRIQWGETHRVFREKDFREDTFYTSASIDPDGYFWVAARHVREGNDNHDVIITRGRDKRNIESWLPETSGLNSTDSQSMAPQIVGLGGGKVYLAAKGTKHGKVFGKLHGGENQPVKDSIIGLSSNVPGDDKRMSMVVERPSDGQPAKIHLVYIDNKNYLRYRVLSSPYNEADWYPSLDKPGEPVLIDSWGRAQKAFSCILSIDKGSTSLNLYLLYGDIKHMGKDPRQITGEFRLARYSGGNWSSKTLLMSEIGEKYNMYPNMIENTEKKIGIIYKKNIKYPAEIMFSSADKSDVDRYFDTNR